MRALILSFAFGGLVAAFGCGKAPGDEGPPDAGAPCERFACQNPGRTRCVVEDGRPRCACDEGLEEQGPLCVTPTPPDPCVPNPCTQLHRSVCLNFSGEPRCLCDEGYELEGPTCRPLIPVDCTGAHTDGDAFEPDECPELARDIGTSGEQEEPHTFAPAGDNDWFVVRAGAGQVLSFRAVSQGTSPNDFRADVYAGAQLQALGPQRTGEERVDFAVKAEETAEVFLRLRAGTFEEQGAYTVSIGDEGFDDFPDEVLLASEHPLATAHEGRIQFEGDVDTLAFGLSAMHSYRVDTTWLDAPGPLKVDLFRPGAASAYRQGQGAAADALVTHAGAGGLHAVALSAAAGTRGGAFTVQVTDLGPDDHPDHPAEANGLHVNVLATGALERDGDRDVFRFDAEAGHIYRFTCTPPGGSDCLVRLFGPSGAQVAADEDGGEGDLFRKLALGGSYVAQVFAPAGQTFSYTYRLQALGPDDHGDSPGAATSLGMPVVSAQGTGVLQFPGDVDFLHLDADPEHIYRIRCARTSLGDCHLRVFNALGIPVAQDTDGGDVDLYYEFTPGGDHYLEFYGAPGQLGGFEWLVEDLEHDDHGSVLSMATLMSANSAWVLGHLQTPSDRDWFRFGATAGRAYRFTCQPLTLSHCELRLYDLAENLLASHAAGPGAHLTWTAPATAFFAFRIQSGGPMGTYQVRVEDLGSP